MIQMLATELKTELKSGLVVTLEKLWSDKNKTVTKYHWRWKMFPTLENMCLDSSGLSFNHVA